MSIQSTPCLHLPPIDICTSDVARIWCEGGWAQDYKKLFVAHEMTRNDTPNKVHVAATELPQNVWRGNRRNSLSDSVQF